LYNKVFFLLNLKIKTDNNPANSLNTFIIGHSFNSYITQNITHDGTNLRYDQTNTGAIINFAGSNIAFSTVASGTAGTIPVLSAAVLIGATQTVLYNNVKLPNLSGTGTRTVVVDAGGVLSTVTTPVAVGYKVYTALLSQTGTNAPTATVLDNTLGGAVTWSYFGVGQYIANTSSLFTTSKTVFFMTRTNPPTVSFTTNVGSNAINTSQAGITVFSDTGYVDGQVSAMTIEIRVYN
jgi:hypothetical protein